MNVHRLEKREPLLDPAKSSSMNDATDGESKSDKALPVTITLSEQDRRAATHLLNVLVGEADDRGRELTTLAKRGPQGISNEERAVLAERARQTYVNRARRSQILNSAMFGEAAWDMLLALYVTDLSGARHTVTGLINLSGVPQTTALRWLDFLDSKEQLVSRRPSPKDGRVFLIELTDKARGLLDAYFSGTVPDGI
jgi:DNA-binding MarR family transcriptional regulator